jgi:hypothetical protein
MLTEDEWQALGIIASGLLAGHTVYTNKYGRIVHYPVAPPTGPPSSLQLQYRDRFARAQAAWSALTDADKALLELVTHMLSLPLTGQNLYMRLAMQTNQGKRITLQRQTGLTLPPIPFVPFLP